MKALFYLTALYLLVIVNTPVFSQIQVMNPGFENGAGDIVYYWETNAWRNDPGLFSWEIGSGRENSNCIKIEIDSSSPNDAAYFQVITGLDPDKWYRLSAWVKGENISEENVRGASIGIYETYQLSKGMTGTFDWTQIYLDFQPDASGEAKISCRMGFWGSTSYGTAYFDDIVLEERSSISSDHFVLVLDEEDLTVITPENLQRWLDHLDASYLKYNELTGHFPYDGEKITILSVDYYPGGWAVAGNPIKWFKDYIKGSLESINNDDNWSFGILHEIGHDFDDHSWNFEGEVLANFKMWYVLDELNGKVRAENNYYVGTEIEALFEVKYQELKEQYRTTGSLRQYGAAILYRLAEIKNVIGWEPFKQTFRFFYALEDSLVPTDRVEKYLLFIEKLTDFSGTDVYELIPQDDMNEFIAVIGDGPVNEIPELELGDPVTIFEGDTLFVVPVCSDDNYPNETLEYEWTKIGNENYKLSRIAGETISAIFPEKGEYVLRLKVWDGYSKAVDTLNITVIDQPYLEIGEDMLVALTDTVFLEPVLLYNGIADDSYDKQWTILSDESACHISDDNAKDIYVTFSQSGIHKLKLTAAKDDFELNDEITIIANDGPIVDAGNDFIIILDDIKNIEAYIEDDGYPNDKLEILWSALDSSSYVSISDPDGLSTDISFSKVGVYHIEVSVSDGHLDAVDTLIATVVEQPYLEIGKDILTAITDTVYLEPVLLHNDIPDDSYSMQWTIMSDGSACQISDENAKDIYVTFSQSGIHKLKLTATMDDIELNDEISIIANACPEVDAGNDFEVFVDEIQNIEAYVEDDGYPYDNLEILWSALDSSNYVSITDPAGLNTDISFSKEGVYHIEVSVSDGHLDAKDTLVFTVNKLVGVEETELNISALSVYPNPVSDFMNVDFRINSPGNVKISIINQLGSEILLLRDEFKLPGSYSGSYNIDKKLISSGLYFLKLHTKNEVFIQNIVVER